MALELGKILSSPYTGSRSWNNSERHLLYRLQDLQERNTERSEVRIVIIYLSPYVKALRIEKIPTFSPYRLWDLRERSIVLSPCIKPLYVREILRLGTWKNSERSLGT